MQPIFTSRAFTASAKRCEWNCRRLGANCISFFLSLLLLWEVHIKRQCCLLNGARRAAQSSDQIKSKIIHLFGTNKIGVKCCLRSFNFFPFFLARGACVWFWRPKRRGAQSPRKCWQYTFLNTFTSCASAAAVAPSADSCFQATQPERAQKEKLLSPSSS